MRTFHMRVVQEGVDSALLQNSLEQQGGTADGEVGTRLEAVTDDRLGQIMSAHQIGQPFGLVVSRDHHVFKDIVAQRQFSRQPRHSDVVTRVTAAAVAHAAVQVMWADQPAMRLFERAGDIIHVRARRFVADLHQRVGEDDFHSDIGVVCDLGQLGAVD